MEGGAWKFLSEAQYTAAQKANTLPDVCFATKCSINNMSKVLETLDVFKDSEEAMKNMLVPADGPWGTHTDVSSLSKAQITGARYYAVSKINSSE
jgi:prefoldin subunit 5